MLGIFTFTQAGTDGAVYQMLNHGISTGALFMLAGMLYERKHTYEFKEFGGLATPMPVYATFFLIAVLSSVGLPLMNGFVGEFLVLSGAFQYKMIVRHSRRERRNLGRVLPALDVPESFLRPNPSRRK